MRLKVRQVNKKVSLHLDLVPPIARDVEDLRKLNRRREKERGKRGRLGRRERREGDRREGKGLKERRTERLVNVDGNKRRVARSLDKNKKGKQKARRGGGEGRGGAGERGRGSCERISTSPGFSTTSMPPGTSLNKQ